MHIGPAPVRLVMSWALWLIAAFAIGCAETNEPSRSPGTKTTEPKTEKDEEARSRPTDREGRDDQDLNDKTAKKTAKKGNAKTPSSKNNSPSEEQEEDDGDVFAKLKTGEAQRQLICARTGSDAVRQAFCQGASAPKISNLKELQRLLGLAIVDEASGSGEGGNPGFAFAAQSNGLGLRHVSSINPRAILYSPGPGKQSNFVALAFSRGEPLVELVANDPQTDVPAFYLLRFNKTCHEDESCSAGDLLTQDVEQGWTNYTLYEDRDLTNTIFDCGVCHQPDGPGTRKLLRMQNLQLPWPHWLLDVARVDVSPPGAPNLSVPSNGRIPGLDGIDFNANRALIADFLAIHRSGEYAGIPVQLAQLSAPHDLATFITQQGFPVQPNETAESASTPVGSFPVIYPGKSAGWQRAYDRAVTGQFIGVPYPGPKVTDDTALATMGASLREVLEGSRPKASLPDIREVFRKGEEPDLGFQVKPGLSPQGIIAQACLPCHNDKLDQTTTRAKFNVDLSKTDGLTIKTAVERLYLPKEDPRRMPPFVFKDLTEGEKQAVKAYLESQ